MLTMKHSSSLGVAAAAVALLGMLSCEGGRVEESPGDSDNITTATEGLSGLETGGTDGSSSSTTESEKLDLNNMTTGELPGCVGDGTCNQIDLVFVIDNSGTMGEEQLNLAANLPRLVEQLQDLEDEDGNKVNPSVNIMVTTTDMGHPLCTPFQKPDYTPRQGAPVYLGCNARINRFTSLDPDDPTVIDEACTANCPQDISPGQPYIHFDFEKTNVPNDDVAAALSCIGPQGIDGCGYEAPLESMLQAINPDSCWNDPDQDLCDNDPEWAPLKKGFLRDDAVLAVALITDEGDCSVAPPGGFSFFTDDDQFWAEDPEEEALRATSAVCFNSGVRCDDEDGDGVYEDCGSRNGGNVLHPVDRYITFLDWVRETQEKEVVMLGILGVPPVTERNEVAPFEPTAGGVFDLEYRDWRDGEFDGTNGGGDILPDEVAEGVTADQKRFEFGNIGPGCTGVRDDGSFTGQAIPPVRVREVCESLNYVDDDGEEQIRCCIESICSENFAPAIQCLAGIIQDTIGPAG